MLALDLQFSRLDDVSIFLRPLNLRIRFVEWKKNPHG